MIKNIEQLDQEELLYVKDVIRKYLEECEQDDMFVDKSVKKVNEKLKKNDRNIEKTQRKLKRLQASTDDDFLTIFGTLCSGILSIFLCFKDVTETMGTIGVFAGGTIVSYIANDVVNNLKERSQMNMYKDLDNLEILSEDNKDLKLIKQKLLSYKSYKEELRKFTND